jgi:hypothetical protein
MEMYPPLSGADSTKLHTLLAVAALPKRTMKPWDVHASKQVRLDVSKGTRPLTAARLVVDEHESVV